jgi:hypothetical protein
MYDVRVTEGRGLSEKRLRKKEKKKGKLSEFRPYIERVTQSDQSRV